MNRCNPLRLAVVLAVVAGALAAASPAAAKLAGPNCTWNPKYGCAWFDAKGDRFYVCDYYSDGNAVVVQYVYERRGGVSTGYAVSRGRAVSQTRKGRACPLDRENHRENARFRARVCLADRGNVIEPTCGGWWKSRF
jgi:hypothetical protein